MVNDALPLRPACLSLFAASPALRRRSRPPDARAGAGRRCRALCRDLRRTARKKRSAGSTSSGPASWSATRCGSATATGWRRSASSHRPDWHLLVRLTPGEQPADTVEMAGGLPIPVRFAVDAATTRATALRLLDRYRYLLPQLIPGYRGAGRRSASRGGLVVMQRPGSDPRAPSEVETLLAARLGLPVRVRRLDAVLVDSAAIGGGRVEGPNAEGRRFRCTTGFVVRNGAGPARHHHRRPLPRHAHLARARWRGAAAADARRVGRGAERHPDPRRGRPGRGVGLLATPPRRACGRSPAGRPVR